MSWATLTLADLKTRFSGSEYSSITQAALADGQDADDVAESVIADVVQLVRGKVAACNQNTLGEGVTIPSELRDAALAIARGRVLTRLPGMASLLDEVRREEIRSAERLLGDVAKCDFAIEQPETATTQQMGAATMEVIAEPTRTATRAKLKGLL